MFNEGRRAAWLEIKLSRIIDNYNALRKLTAGCEILASVKADAYGHGATKIAWEYVKQGVDYLAVATIMEAVELRHAGIITPIVLLGATPRGNVKDVVDLGIVPVITTWEDAALLQDMAAASRPKKTIDVFIALETGMGRLGFMPTDFNFSRIADIAGMENLKIKGLFSHLAAADHPDDSYTLFQIEALQSFENTLTEYGVSPSYCCLANSAAIIKYPQSHFEGVRPGISLYGIYPDDISKELIDLKPAMMVKADIVYLKTIPAGFSVSYGMTWTAERESVIGTIPIGYADGLPRMLSGRGRVIVNGSYAPIVGTICMDQCMIDLTDIPSVRDYNEVIIMGSQDKLSITAEEIAAQSNTIPYEVLTRFGQRLPKNYV